MGDLIIQIGKIYKKIGNLHVAIIRGLDWLKEQHPKENIDEAYNHIDEYKAELSHLSDPVDKEPEFTEAYSRNIAITYQEDIEANERDPEDGISYKEAVDELMERQKKMGWSDKKTAEIINYLDWVNKDKPYFDNVVLREPDSKYQGERASNYTLTNSGETSHYLSGDTMEEFYYGKDVGFDKDAKQTQTLENLTRDASNIIGLAQQDAGSDNVFDYGTKLLGQINSWDNPVKRVVALRGLHGEIFKERWRLSGDMRNADADTIAKNEAEIKKLDRLANGVEVATRDVLSKASDTMNAGKVRGVIDGTAFTKDQTDRLLTNEQRQKSDAINKDLQRDLTDAELKRTEKIKSDKDAEQALKEQDAEQQKQTKKLTEKEQARRQTKKDKEKFFREREELQKEKFGVNADGSPKTKYQFAQELKEKIKNKCP